MKSGNPHGQVGVQRPDIEADLRDWTEPGGVIPHTRSERREGQRWGSVLGYQLLQPDTGSHLTWQIRMDGWNLCLILACWGSLLQVQWRQMSTNTGWFWGCSVPSLKWKDRRGGQADVLGCWDDSSSASLGMGGKDEMGCHCFSSAVLRRSADVWRELSPNTWSGGSIVWELAELGRDLMNNKLFTLRMMVGLPPRPSDAAEQLRLWLHMEHYSAASETHHSSVGWATFCWMWKHLRAVPLFSEVSLVVVSSFSLFFS